MGAPPAVCHDSGALARPYMVSRVDRLIGLFRNVVNKCAKVCVGCLGLGWQILGCA